MGTTLTVQDIRLNEIPVALHQALDSVTIDEETGEIVGMDELNALTEKAENKLTGTALYIREREAYLTACQEAIDINTRRIAQEQKRLEWIKARLFEGMKALQYEKIEAPSVVIKFKKNPVHVEIFDDGLVPEKYWVQPEPKMPPPRIDKKLVKDDIENGVEVAGAKLERTEVLVIK